MDETQDTYFQDVSRALIELHRVFERAGLRPAVGLVLDNEGDRERLNRLINAYFRVPWDREDRFPRLMKLYGLELTVAKAKIHG